MATNERSIPDLLENIVYNVQEIVRSEVRLARTEMTEQVKKVRLAAPMLIVGAVAGLLAALFLMWAAVYGLLFLIPLWAAALVVSGFLMLVGGAAASAGMKRLRQINPPNRTIATVKENVQWAKQQVR